MRKIPIVVYRRNNVNTTSTQRATYWASSSSIVCRAWRKTELRRAAWWCSSRSAKAPASARGGKTSTLVEAPEAPCLGLGAASGGAWGLVGEPPPSPALGALWGLGTSTPPTPAFVGSGGVSSSSCPIVAVSAAASGSSASGKGYL